MTSKKLVPYWTESGCSNCGQCCGALPLPLGRKEAKVIAKYIVDNNIKWMPQHIENNNIHLRCCFYDFTNKKCRIYPVRPKICRIFQCNQNTATMDKNKLKIHAESYYNHIASNDDRPQNITNFEFLFYGVVTTLLISLTQMFVEEGTYELQPSNLTTEQREQLQHFLNTFGCKETYNLKERMSDNGSK